MEQPDPAAIERWHRWFAVECNNRAWDLAAMAGRTAAEDRELRLAAHAAAFHWSEVGAPVNEMRAEALLAHAHALLGHGEGALDHARQVLGFCEANECEPWDRAFAHLEMALAAAAAGDAALHARHYAAARELGAALPDEEDRKVFAEEFGRVPERVNEVAGHEGGGRR